MSTSHPNQKQDDNGNKLSLLADIYVGTAGYSYAHWRKGIFYPNHVKQANELRHYSGVFAGVEINASFHGVPREETLQTWTQKAKAGFQFSFKVPQAITHEKRLENIEDPLTFFLNRLQDGLRVRVASTDGKNMDSPCCLGPILFQLPPSLYKNVDKIHDIARHVASLGMASLKVAFEFRNKSWYCEEVFDAMSQHNFGLCENISPDNSTYHTTKVTSKTWHYIRCHKNGDRLVTLYSDQQLAAIADDMVERRKKSIIQYVYFLNDHEGNGPRNAKTLMKMIMEKSCASSGSVPFVSDNRWKPDPVAPSLQSMFAKSSSRCGSVSATRTPQAKSATVVKESPKRSASAKASFFSPSAKRPKVTQSSSDTRVSSSVKNQSATPNKKKSSITDFFSKKI